MKDEISRYIRYIKTDDVLRDRIKNEWLCNVKIDRIANSESKGT